MKTLEGQIKGCRASGRQQYNWEGNIKRCTTPSYQSTMMMRDRDLVQATIVETPPECFYLYYINNIVASIKDFVLKQTIGL